MEGLRGLAVLLVFFVHYVTLAEPWLEPESASFVVATFLRRIGNSGVDLFFVLSGYLIYGALIRRPKPLLPFARRRIARIYPTFLVVFAVYVVLAYLQPATGKLPEGGGAQAIYLVQNLLLLPGIFDIRPLITVAWSLSYEVFYYLTIPIVIALLGLRRWGRLPRVLFFLGASVAWFVTCYVVQGEHLRLVMFLAGILLYEAVDAGRGRATGALGLPALALATVAMAVVHARGYDGTWRFVALYACFFVLCLSCFAGGGTATRWFSWSPLRWWGNMSYSYYLVHGLALKVGFEGLARLDPPAADDSAVLWLYLVPMLAATLLAGGVLFVCVEKPLSLAPKGSASAVARSVPAGASLSSAAPDQAGRAAEPAAPHPAAETDEEPLARS